jgi:hypothetical protein
MENSKNQLNSDFNYPAPTNDEDNPGDIEYEKILEKEIESNCTFNKYIDKLELRNDFTDEELISQKTKEEIIAYKNEQLTKLKAFIASLEQEKEDLINSFKNTTNALLDKIKDLELKLNNNNSLPLYIERPKTAMIVKDLQENENNEYIDKNKKQRCPNCQKEILQSEFIAHSLTCLRHSFKCKKCGELINDASLKEHINNWLKPERIFKSIKENNIEEFKLILEHGLKDDCIVDEKEGDYIYHVISRYNKYKYLNELNKRNIQFNIDILNKNKETPLITAIDNKSIECGEILVKMGANITIRNKGDLSPLMLACKYGFVNLVNILINNGANINEKNILGETALSIAQLNHHDDLAMKILQKSQIKFNK